MFDSIYGLDVVAKYEGRILGTLPPHIFAMGAAAYNRLVTKNGENQVKIICKSSILWFIKNDNKMARLNSYNANSQSILGVFD